MCIQITYLKCCLQNLKSTFHSSFGAEIKSQIKISYQMTYKDYWLICGSFITVLVVEGLTTSRRFCSLNWNERDIRIQSLPPKGEGRKKKEREKSRCKVSASFTAPVQRRAKTKKGELQHDAGVPPVVSRGGFSSNPAETRKPTSQTSVI